jgi:hypothetical protein
MSDQQQQVQEPDYLSMSDEEIMNMTGPVVATTVVDEADEEVDPNEQDAQDGQDQAADNGDNDNTENADQDGDEDGDGDGDENTEGESDDAAAEGAGTATDGKAESEDEAGEQTTDGTVKPAADKKDSDKAEKTESNESTIDYKSEYERLLTPFKANGRDIQVKNIDEAITLMQMGANYNKKMAALKPNLKLMKLLEKSNLLSEEKISFLIDLDRKNPAAINKLVSDSGIDPMDLTAEKASAYKQTAYTVDDREIELDTVLDELQGTPSYNRTLEIVGTKWDAASKHVIADNPGIMRVINSHVQSGIYDRIQAEIDNERMFGRLIGVSDIEAYRQVGDRLHAQGAFNSMGQGSSQTRQQTQPVQKQVVQPKPKQVDTGALKDKKRAASSTKSVVSNSNNQDFNPLAMSDEEFSKHVNKQFL